MNATLNAVVLAVNTTNGATIPDGMVQISANERETKDYKPTAESRYRNILIKELSLPNVPDTLRPVLLDKLYALAQEQFTAYMKDTNRMALTADPAQYTLEGILSYYSTEATSGRVTKEAIVNWFESSATKAYIVSKGANPKAYETNYAKFASPNHGVNPNTCRALVATMQAADVTNSRIAEYIVKQAQRTIDKSMQSEVDAL